MVSQLIIFLAHIVPATLLWYLSLTEIIPTYAYLPELTHHFITFAPIYAIIALGIYAVWSVVYGVATFNDCSEARDELVKEIQEAREDLRRRKVID